MRTIMTLGVDVGNFYTKTQSVVIPSGFIKMSTLPYGTDNYVLLNGNYYVSDEHIFPYERDKTKTENAFILSLLAISGELLKEAEKCNKKKVDAAEQDETKKRHVLGVQGELNQLKEIKLGIGLPPTHMSTLCKKMKQYYIDRIGEGITYVYNGYEISFMLNAIECFPQDYAAVLTYRPKDREDSAVTYPSFYAIDIGGWTVDIITISNRKLSMEKCDSKPLGVLAMYEKMIKDVEIKTGKRLSQTDIECILKGEKTLLRQDVIEEIKHSADEWYARIMSELKQFGIEMDMYPVLFIGGGSALFKKQIKADKSIIKYEFISGSRSNAIGYALLMDANKS